MPGAHTNDFIGASFVGGSAAINRYDVIASNLPAHISDFPRLFRPMILMYTKLSHGLQNGGRHVTKHVYIIGWTNTFGAMTSVHSAHTLTIWSLRSNRTRKYQDRLDMKRWNDKRWNRVKIWPHTITIRLRFHRADQIARESLVCAPGIICTGSRCLDYL